MTVAINSIKRVAEPKEPRRSLGIRPGLDPEIPRSHGRRNDQSVAIALDRGALGSYHRPGSAGFGTQDPKLREDGGIGSMDVEAEVEHAVVPMASCERHVREVDSNHLRARCERRRG